MSTFWRRLILGIQAILIAFSAVEGGWYVRPATGAGVKINDE